MQIELRLPSAGGIDYKPKRLLDPRRARRIIACLFEIKAGKRAHVPDDPIRVLP
jgi:hypothetical protein